MAPRFLPTFRRGTDPGPPDLETKGLAERVRSNSRGYNIPGQPYSSDWNVARAVEEGFQSNPWVFRSVEVICSTALQRQIVLRQGDPITGPAMPARGDDSRLLYRLNRRANPWETAKLWRYRLLAQWLLSSKGVFVEVARNQVGGYALFHLLDPDLTDPVPSKTSPIGSFQMRTTVGDSGRIYNELPPFDPNSAVANSVLWLRSPHPTIMHRGMSPIEAAGLSIDLDRHARLYNRDYMQSGGRPDGILAVKGIAEWDTIERLEAKFNDGSRTGKTTAIQADAIDYEDLSTAPRDMQWSEVMDRMKNEANIAFGVPESMMGNASGRTFDNADAEVAGFWEHRMGPLLALLDDQLDVLTPGGHDDELWLRHDTSDVWVLSRHKRSEQDRAAADLNRGAITIDDYRERIGLERLDVPATRVLWLPPGSLAIGDGQSGHERDAELAAANPTAGTPLPADPGEEAAAGAAQGAEIASYNAQTNANAAGLRLVAGQSQGRSIGGGSGAFETRKLPVGELEGKQGGARDPGDDAPDPPPWR